MQCCTGAANLAQCAHVLESLGPAHSLPALYWFQCSNPPSAALGLANLAGSAFSAYNTTGSLSRSAVNSDVGAKTPLAGGIAGKPMQPKLSFSASHCALLLSHYTEPSSTRTQPSFHLGPTRCSPHPPAPSGLLLALTLLFLTPLFTHMSKNVQGAIIIVGVLSLFDWRECVFLFRVSEQP